MFDMLSYEMGKQKGTGEIAEIKSDLTFDEYLINNGTYTIKVGDLESGQWSFSSKVAVSTRARTKNLLPVRAGMTISYNNTTFDTFFGVLETPTSPAYIQTPGWKTDGSGTVSITNDGWLTFVIRNHADNTASVDPSEFDSVVTIGTASQNTITSISNDIAEVKSDLTFDEYLINNGTYTIKVSDLESGQWAYSTKASNPTRARTKNLLPVRAGMTISYVNTTFDIFIGVLETPTSQTYIGAPTWITNGSGIVIITNDGWMTFIIRNHADNTANVDPSDYNSVVTIRTALYSMVTSILSPGT